jgi:transcriptional antiterminator RfaH
MKWYVLYTRHHHERAVYERLLAKGFQSYLPLIKVWRKSYRGLRRGEIPLIPRHVFVRCYLEMYAHLELISIPGVMRVLEDPEGHLCVVPEHEMRLLRMLSESDAAPARAGDQPQGQLVEVVQGRLRGVCGIVREEATTTLLVPLHTLQTSVAVEVSRTQVMPCTEAGGESSQRSFLRSERRGTA